MNRNPYNRGMPGIYDPSVSDLIRDQSFSLRNGLYQPVREENLILRDTTLGDVSITRHGFAPKLPNDATKYLDGTGAYSVPAGGGGGGTYDELDTLLGKKFFVDEGILGSMTLFKRYAGTPDAFTGTPTGAWTRLPGNAMTTSVGIAYYDIGSLKTEILLILGGSDHQVDFPCLTIWPGASAPTNSSTNCIFAMNYSGGYIVQKQVSGGFTSLITAANYTVSAAAMAFYINFTSKVKIIYARKMGNWYHCGTETSDATFASARYVGFRTHGGAGRFHSPFACYTN